MFYHPLIARELAAAHIRDLTAQAASWRLAAPARGRNGPKPAGRAAAAPPCPDAGPITGADAAAGSRGPAADQVMYRAGAQLPGPVAEVAEVRSALALLRAEYARLVTAARASVTAARAGAADPVVYVEAELARHGGLPPQGVTVPGMLADAGAGMVLAGRAARPSQPVKAAA